MSKIAERDLSLRRCALLLSAVKRDFSRRSSCAETDNHRQGAINLTKLSKREQPLGFAEPAWIDCPELLDQDPGQPTVDLHLGSERGRMGARRCRRDDHTGQAEQFIGLKYHAVPGPGLFVSSGSSGRPQPKDLTSLHEAPPSNGPREPSRHDPRGQR
jgi:hypothetical protein